jgi:hypothetical protein
VINVRSPLPSSGHHFLVVLGQRGFPPTNPGGSSARTYLNKGNEMNTGPEETSEENPEKKEKIERVPEGTFGGTRDRLSDVEGDEPVPDDTGDQGHGQN